MVGYEAVDDLDSPMSCGLVTLHFSQDAVFLKATKHERRDLNGLYEQFGWQIGITIKPGQGLLPKVGGIDAVQVCCRHGNCEIKGW